MLSGLKFSPFVALSGRPDPLVKAHVDAELSCKHALSDSRLRLIEIRTGSQKIGEPGIPQSHSLRWSPGLFIFLGGHEGDWKVYTAVLPNVVRLMSWNNRELFSTSFTLVIPTRSRGSHRSVENDLGQTPEDMETFSGTP